MKIAIDGPAGSGKSSVAKAIAKAHAALFLDTGAMYRAISYKFLGAYPDFTKDSKLSEEQRKKAIEFAHTAKIELVPEDGKNKVILDGIDITEEIRTAEVDAVVSTIAGIPEVRVALVAKQQELAKTQDVVAEGRDTTTVVLPDAEVKIYLSASPEARAKRRTLERSKDGVIDPKLEAEILAAIIARDKHDIEDNKALVKAKDAIEIDSTDLSFDEVVQKVENIVAEKTKATKKKQEPKKAKKQPEDKPLRAFHNNSYDAYFDSAINNFPLPSRLWRAFVIHVVSGFTKIFWPWKVEGLENLPDNSKTGSVIIMNHTSIFDPIPIIVSSNKVNRSTRAVYKSEFDKHAITTWLYSRIGAFPVVRGTADMKALRRSVKSLKRGEDLLIYPEGTRVRRDEDAEIHGGFTLMAQMAKAPVVPVAIVGARNIKPEGSHFVHFGRIYVRIGKPLYFKDIDAPNKKAALKAMENKAMDAVYALRDDLRKEHPGKM